MSQAPVGILALQGAVREHQQMLETLGRPVRRVREPGDLVGLAGLILPGGESTVMDKLTRRYGVREPIRTAISGGLPVFGTCAGLILLADRIADGIEGQLTLGGLDVLVRRNAFGSQVDSFEADLQVPELGDAPCRAVFIRAPIVESVGDRVRVLASVDDRIVAVEQGNLLGLSFHPELAYGDVRAAGGRRQAAAAGERRWHEYFLRQVDAAGLIITDETGRVTAQQQAAN